MTDYLRLFMTRCGYNETDIAYFCDVYTRLILDAAANDCLDNIFDEYERNPCDHARIITLADDIARHLDIHEYTAELLCYLLLTKPLHARYQTRGIDDEIFFNTMCDLRWKLEECKVVKGVCGTFVASWFAGFFELTRFALGRLQFEIIPFGEHYEKDGKHLTPDSPVINVHIPRTGTPLDKQSCDTAYAKAAAFFADRVKGDIAFVCYSWLLYPENEAILPAHSNIVRFASEYDIIKSGISKDRVDLWRLFDTDEQHPDRLPTDTSARCAYVAHLQNGGKLGWGYGVKMGLS